MLSNAMFRKLIVDYQHSMLACVAEESCKRNETSLLLFLSLHYFTISFCIVCTKSEQVRNTAAQKKLGILIKRVLISIAFR